MLKVLPGIFIVFLVACGDVAVEPSLDSIMEIPEGFPLPEYPTDNEMTMNRWLLGKRLFYDPVMSRDMTLACSSCHVPELGFTDAKTVSEGVEHRSGTRNAPTLANVAYHPYLTREGGVKTLEMQVLVPIQEHAEFDFNILLIAERLNADSTYVKASWDAYDRAPDPYVITRAISCFERSLISGNSRYDKFINGNAHAFTEEEMKGKNLFFSERLACAECHNGFNFTNYSFENNGLYTDYNDEGRFRLTGDSAEIALFKVPTLRNIAVSAPYMHDGSLSSLEEVIEHYNSGGKNHRHQSHFVKPLHLSQQEQEDLIAFLHTLTDHDFLTNPNFKY